MTTFDEFKSKAISSKVTLAELSLKKECLTWTVHSGACYKTTFNDSLSGAPIDISSVEEDGTALTESTDLADCIASAGEWYQDISAGLLYVHCTAGANPNTKVLISIFKVYFSTEGKVFNSIYYIPCIPTDGISLDCSSDYVDSGNLTLLNGDALFDTKLEDWIWRGCSCTVKMGGDSLTYAQYETMGDFLIQAIDFTNQNIVLNLKGIKMNWNRQLPINEFYTSEETLRPNAVGTYANWTPSAGAAWQCVDDATGNYGDKFTTYIKLTSGAEKESFNLPASSIPAGAVINFVSLYVAGRVKENKDHRINLFVKSGATEDTKDFGHYWGWASWDKKMHSWATNPATGVAWIKADIDTLEIGVDGDIKIAGQELYVTQVYLIVNYSVMKTFDEGKCLPILIGELPVAEDATFTPVLIDNTVQKGKFGLADKSVQRIKSVDVVKYEGNTLTAGAGNDYIADLTNCILTILDTSAYTVDDPSALKVNLKGARIDDITGEASTTHITSASNILRHLFDRVLEWDNAKIDDSSFDTAATSAPQECRLFITDRMYVADIIALICQSVKGILSQNRDGVLYFNIWSESDTGALTLQDEDILEFKINERRIMPAYRVIVKYGRDPDSGDWKLETAKDDSVKYKYEQVETKTFETLLVNKNDARDLAYEFLDAYKNPIKEIEILVKLQASKLRVGDKIKITRTRAPDSAGSWTAETFQVKTVTKEGRYKTRLILEPNMYLSAVPISTNEKMKYDDKEAISRAIACLTTNAYCFKSDRKIEGRDEAIGTTVIKIKADGDFKGDIYDSGGTIKLLDVYTRKIEAGLLDAEGSIANIGIKRGKHGFQDLTGRLVSTAKVNGRSEALSTTISKIKADGNFKGDLYDTTTGTTQLLNATTKRITANLLDVAGQSVDTGCQRGYGGFMNTTGKLVSSAVDSADRAINTHIGYVASNLDANGLKAGRDVGANLTTTQLDHVIVNDAGTGKVKASAFIDDTDGDAVAAGANRALASVQYDSGNRNYLGCLKPEFTGVNVTGTKYKLSIYDDGTRKYLIVGSAGGGGGTGEEEGKEYPEV